MKHPFEIQIRKVGSEGSADLYGSWVKYYHDESRNFEENKNSPCSIVIIEEFITTSLELYYALKR